MANQLEASKLLPYAMVGPAPASGVVTKLAIYAMLSNASPPPPVTPVIGGFPCEGIVSGFGTGAPTGGTAPPGSFYFDRTGGASGYKAYVFDSGWHAITGN